MRLITLILIFFTLAVGHAKPIRIGAPPYSPPFIIEVDNNQHFAGFDVDLMMGICKRINAECIFVPMLFIDEFAAINKGSIDLAMGNITITTNREQKYLFSLPYLTSYAQFITYTSSKINSEQDLIGKTVGIIQSTVFENSITKKFGKRVSIKTYKELTEVLEALSNNDIDAAFLDQATAEVWYANSRNDFKLLGKPIPEGFGYGIMTTKFNTNIITLINDALLSMEADGSYLKIYSTYFGSSGINTP